MKGHRNHGILKNDKFLGNAVLEGYGLYNVSSFPCIIKQNDAAVKGEAYNISESTLKRLDELENEGVLYTRRLVTIDLKSNKKVNAYVYIWNNAVNPQSYLPFEKLPWKPEDRKKLKGIINTQNLTDEQIIKESKEFDKLLNKRNYKYYNCKVRH
jgi:gamma-glutamylcyclotransferase (GGCT)/AIG2-like uncharacterized protein YtfP